MNCRRYACLAAFLPLLAGGCGDETPVPARPRPVKYAVVRAANADEARSFPASVQPRDATQLSFRVGGNLEKLTAKLGGTVKRGQLIASLDQTDYRVAVAQAKASYQSAKTARDTAQSSFERVEKLFEAGSSSQSDYENAKGQLKSAQAQLAAATQQVKQARNQLDYTALRAPFDGVVNSIPVNAGEQIGAGKTVAIISKGGALEVNVRVPEGIVSRIAVGTPAVVTMSALAEGPMQGKVREVGFVSENSTYPVHIELDAVPSALRPGMAAQARFELGQSKTGLAVPAAAVGNAASGPFVFLLETSADQVYIARKKSIVLGDLVAEHFEITKGLEAGDKVATAGLANLVDGMKVRLLQPRSTDTSPGRAAAEAQP
ncbi:MAG: efflux RND transporter periplasmic adaptor subunit [Proteobacteria bacterium]|nr:efflux RND transporter periplasmic adaptor subunit [Pseudomonadota bacterium]